MSSEAGSDLFRDLAHTRALHRVIIDLAAELGATLGRIESALAPDTTHPLADRAMSNIENQHDY
ncbi:hypothetical protein B9Z07_28255 [Burkholderia cenocepacia]|uniref:Uncharacterized protein n=2 Tax=Burkholderia cenocepacia TaxID=95486 RepID=A0AAD0J4R5_9BURK|nr:hypothetical protein B9Z07_28255 [Burkholderia cenocepacia]PRE33734.1 hypothetical protein C6P63_26515 [Burkholderia cenocepacia]